MNIEDNKFPLVAELKLRLEKTVMDEQTCYAYLTLGEDDFEIESGIFSVGFKCVFLKTDFSGFRPVLGSKFGEVVKANEVEVVSRVSTDHASKTALGASAGVEATSQAILPKFSFSGAKSTAKNVTSQEVIEDSYTAFRVKVRGGDTWQVDEIATGRALSGTYLDDVPLVILENDSERTNRQSVTGILYAKQRDLVFERVQSHPKKRHFELRNKNKDRLLAIFAAKKIHDKSIGADSFKGLVTLSHVEVTNDID